MPQIVELLASPLSRYVGRPASGPLAAPTGELLQCLEIRAGLGVVGDRYFGKRAHRDAAVTLMAQEVLPAAAELFLTRRNVFLRDVDVDALIGSTITLDSGDGPVRLQLNRPANPCGWLDVVIGPGARAALRGRGGARCSALSDGTLRVGPVIVHVE